MPQINGTITQAAPRFIERRDGTGSFPLYEVWIDGQGPFVARRDVFSQAERLVGQRVLAVTRDEQKGNFLNHYLDFVEATNGGNYMPQPQTPVQTPQQPAQQPQTAAQVMEQGRAAEAARERETRISIHRQKASDVATKLGQESPLVFWENVQALFRYYETGETPLLPMAAPQQPPQQNAAAYRQFVPENFDPGPDPTKPDPDDESLPF